MIEQIVSNTTNFIIAHVEIEGRRVKGEPATGAEAVEVRWRLRMFLAGSALAREQVRALMNGRNVHYFGFWAHSSVTATDPGANQDPTTGSTSTIGVNLSEEIVVWTHDPNTDRMRQETLPWDVVFFHELVHAREAELGVMGASHFEREMRATGLRPTTAAGSENAYRIEQGMPLRQCYYDCTAPYFQER
jgi:hypothetical protein